MWEWFFANEAWIIVASIVIIAFFFFSFRKQIRHSAEEIAAPQSGLSKARVFGLAVVATLIVIGAMTGLAIVFSMLNNPDSVLSVIWDDLQAWLIAHGIPILLIVILSYVTYRVIKSLIPVVIKRSVKVRYVGDESELSKRSETLSRIIISTIGITIFTFAVLMVLDETGRDITPLIAGASVIGVAVGLGAQSLVKDVLNGLFIILEDQYRKGDVITIAGLSGMVEDLSLRRTVLRDRNGTVHTIPNGQISTASNMTKEWSRINIDIPVAYYEDLNRVMGVINRVGTELAEDPLYRPLVISAPKSFYVDDFDEKGVIIKVLGETKPLRQWDVASEFRRRLKIAFDKEGIVIPWAYGGIYTGKKEPEDTQTCKVCHYPNQPGAKKCASCGAELNQTESQKPANHGGDAAKS